MTVDALRGRRVYLDANVFIYGLNLFPQYAAVVTRVFSAIDDGEFEAFSSDLTAAELLVKPLKDGDAAAEAACRAILFGNDRITVSSVSRDIIIEAAGIRAFRTVKIPDAIHLATAKECNCDVFLTNDHRMKNVAVGPAVVLLSDLKV